jgi:hypothetical protein
MRKCRAGRRRWPPLLHAGAGLLDQSGDVLARGRQEDPLPRRPVEDEDRLLGPQPAGLEIVPTREHAVVEPHDEAPVPREGRVVGASQHEAHRVAIALDELTVLLGNLAGALADEDSAHLVHGHVHALHPRGGGHGLDLEIAAQPPLPGAHERPPVVEAAPPAVQLLAQGPQTLRPVRKQGHKRMLCLKC